MPNPTKYTNLMYDLSFITFKKYYRYTIEGVLISLIFHPSQTLKTTPDLCSMNYRDKPFALIQTSNDG